LEIESPFTGVAVLDGGAVEPSLVACAVSDFGDLDAASGWGDLDFSFVVCTG
jgi:hypothetical protein